MNDDRPGFVIESMGDIGFALNAGLEAGSVLLTEQQLGPQFFDLRTGVAGELFQKLINYRIPTAIVVPEPTIYGKRFEELAYEHRSHALIRILPAVEDAQKWLVSANAS